MKTAESRHYRLSTVTTWLVVIGLAACLAAPPADALNRKGTYVYATSTLPKESVGLFDPILTQACQLREFNQDRPYYMVIRFVGDRSPGLSGIATTDWNLYDPKGLAAPRMTFHFFNDGYSNCRVYVSPQR